MAFEQKKYEPRAPDYKGDGIAIWKAQDKNGNTYLRCKILNGLTVNAFKYEAKIKKETTTEENI